MNFFFGHQESGSVIKTLGSVYAIIGFIDDQELIFVYKNTKQLEKVHPNLVMLIESMINLLLTGLRCMFDEENIIKLEVDTFDSK